MKTTQTILSSIILLAMCFCWHADAFAQDKTIDSINSKITLYNVAKPRCILFAHFDKTIYAQNESVWFTAYQLYQKSTRGMDAISVLLVNNLDKSIVMEQRFPMADGLAFGNIQLPDSIPPGNYTFMLYANQLFKGKPNDVFTQPITIVTTSEPIFKVSMQLDTNKENPLTESLILTVTTKNGIPVPQARVAYKLGNIVHVTLSGNVTTDNEGKCLVRIPRKQVNTDPMMEIHVNHNQDRQNVTLNIPFKEKEIKVKFYPEGGYLVHATACLVGIEAKTDEGAPVKTWGVMFKDGVAVDTIQTDAYGMGRFKLIPMLGSSYTFKLLSGGSRDSTFNLPKILPKSATISIARALVGDTLDVNLVSKYPEKVTVLVHNYRQIFYSFPFNALAAGNTIRINLKDLPKGLTALTILDSNKRPCNERLFFAHYDRRSQIDIRTDKSLYAKREKVTMSFKTTTGDTALVSVACVQSNRLQIKSSNDIESYVFLKHELEALPLRGKYIGSSKEDKAYLENILLIKGWRRYKWQEMMELKAIDTISDGERLLFSGVIKQFGAPIRKPVKLVVVTDSSTNTEITDEKGYFVLKNSWLLTRPNKNVRFLVMAKNESSYKVTINDPYLEINQKIAHGLQVSSNPMALNRDSLGLTGLDHAISLKEVKVIGHKDVSLRQTTINPRHGQNACGDYVCRYNVLNCVNHAKANDNRAAVIGETYIGFNGIPVVYKECGQTRNQDALKLTTMKGLNYAMEFYGSDYSFVNPSEPEYYSTIFWKYLIKVEPLSETRLSFFTSDLKGPFKIIVQGITNSNVVYGEKEFEVK